MLNIDFLSKVFLILVIYLFTKVLETPPITPPDSNSILIDSPPTSPSEASSSSGSVSPLPTTTLHPSTAVITVTSDPQSPPKKKKIPLAPKIPFTVVTTITANGK